VTQSPLETLQRALECHRQNQLAEAERLYRQVLSAEPNNADALNLLGVLAHQTGHHQAAVALITHAIRLMPAVAAMHNNLGEAHRALADYPLAIVAYRRAIALDEHFAEAHNNLGTVWQLAGRPDEALAEFDRAIACRADYANPHYNRARLWLSQGDWSRGWPEYEWRWQRAEFVRPPQAAPDWDGTPRHDRRLLIRAEQGLGDTLQFLRYVRLLERQGTQVVTEVQPQLLPLLEKSGFASLVAQGEPVPAVDVQVALLSLPGLLGTTLDNLPAEVPYLSADAARVARWQTRLAALPKPLIAIHWQGNPRSPLEPLRSPPLAAFEPVARATGGTLVSVQKGPGVDQIAAIADRCAVVDLSAELDADGAFLDTAAVVSLADLVITSDSAVAHLSGALARPVWVVLPCAADWRWLTAREDSPWYPTMRLFRQLERGHWTEVFARVAAELDRHDLIAANRLS
jgi:tetratricopeptide (TPR) repeat protein